jgi:hypothetical protein
MPHHLTLKVNNSSSQSSCKQVFFVENETATSQRTQRDVIAMTNFTRKRRHEIRSMDGIQFILRNLEDTMRQKMGLLRTN